MIEIYIVNRLEVAIVDDVDGNLASWKWHIVVSNNGGIRIINCVKGVRVSIADVIAGRMCLIWNKETGETIDHIDRDSFNNRRSNLRVATKSQQAYNRNKVVCSESNFIGVTRNKKNWSAVIDKEKIRYYLGTFNTEEEAAKWRDVCALILHGEYVVLNFPERKVEFMTMQMIIAGKVLLGIA